MLLAVSAHRPPTYPIPPTAGHSHSRSLPPRASSPSPRSTQYDLVLLEQDSAGPFGGRPDAHVSSLVGYGGGNYASPGGGGGAACYHGIPGTDYGRLGHAEAVSVELSAQPSAALRQVAALSELYFAHGFRSRSCSGPSALGCVDTPGAGWQRRQRLDPADAGPMCTHTTAATPPPRRRHAAATPPPRGIIIAARACVLSAALLHRSPFVSSVSLILSPPVHPAHPLGAQTATSSGCPAASTIAP